VLSVLSHVETGLLLHSHGSKADDSAPGDLDEDAAQARDGFL